MKQIICLSHAPWRARPNRTQQLLTRLPDCKILFFEPPAKDPDRERTSGLRVRSNIVVYSLPAPRLEGSGSRLILRHNQRRQLDLIHRTMDRHQFLEPVVWCSTPRSYFLADQLVYHTLVYDCHREWDGLPEEWESELAIAADVVFAASPGLMRRLAPCNDNVALLPNAANPLMFLRDDLTPPDYFARLPRPVFARVGDLTSDLDLEPLFHTARWRPDWTFLMIGRVSRSAQEILSPLPNVVLVGPVATVELPDHLAGCDVLFDLHHTRRNSDVVPSRIFEYFSTGKPVVDIIPEGQIEQFPGLIYTGRDPGGFLQGCDAALEERDHQLRLKRLEVARISSWSRRAQEVARILSLI